MKGRLSAFAAALGAELIGADGEFVSATIDTRRITPGALFFALSGANHDGHAFVARAGAAGAAAAVVTRAQNTNVPQLVVDDVVGALQRAARLARAVGAYPTEGALAAEAGAQPAFETTAGVPRGAAPAPPESGGEETSP